MDVNTSDGGAIAVVLAAGTGNRFGTVLPKQFQILAGKPILAYATETLARHPDITEVIIVHPAAYEAEARAVADRFAAINSIRLVAGCTSRPGSTRAALGTIPHGSRRKILFHDAVRPFVTHEIIDRCLDALDNYDAVDTVVPAVDTIVMLDEASECLDQIPPRARLRRGQTPQAFWLDQIQEAYESLGDDVIGRFTDDCGVIMSRFPDVRVAAVDGHENNIKITSPLDMFLAEQILYSGMTLQPPKPAKVDGKTVAVLFGGNSGLGLAAANRLRELGWTVEVASRSTGVDVRDLGKVKECLAAIHQSHGRVDLVANFAGILQVGRLDLMDLATVDEIMSVNVMGSVVVSQASMPYLGETKGHLVLTSSSSYYRGRAETAAYSASKAAVVNLTQALAEEWTSQGITVSCIVPRRADTKMRRDAFPNEDPSLNLDPNAVADAIIELYMKQQTGIVKHVY